MSDPRSNAENHLAAVPEGPTRAASETSALAGIGWAILELADAIRDTSPRASYLRLARERQRAGKDDTDE